MTAVNIVLTVYISETVHIEMCLRVIHNNDIYKLYYKDNSIFMIHICIQQWMVKNILIKCIVVYIYIYIIKNAQREIQLINNIYTRINIDEVQSKCYKSLCGIWLGWKNII